MTNYSDKRRSNPNKNGGGQVGESNPTIAIAVEENSTSVKLVCKAGKLLSALGRELTSVLSIVIILYWTCLFGDIAVTPCFRRTKTDNSNSLWTLPR